MRTRNTIGNFLITAGLIGGFALLSQPTLAGGKKKDFTTKCYETSSDAQVTQYCVFETKGSTSRDIVYYLHGAGGDERDWENEDWADEIRKTWKKKGIPAPRVVGISMGKYWLLKGKETEASPYATFKNQVVATVENQLHFSANDGKRLALGVSMGGINLSSVLIKDSTFFDKMAIICPVIPELPPYSPLYKVHDYVDSTGADRYKVDFYLQLSQSFYQSDEEWEAEYPPYYVAERLGPQSTELYLSAGTKDSFGIFEAVKAFAQSTKDQGVPTTWDPNSGGHCELNSSAIAEFLH